jgi:hypothetical protein
LGRRLARGLWGGGGPLLLPLLVAACWPGPADRDAYVGRWRCSHSGLAVDTLSLAGDGTYEQALHLTDGREFRTRGAWRYRPPAQPGHADPGVSVDSAWIVHTEWPTRPVEVRRGWPSPSLGLSAERRWGILHLSWHPDLYGCVRIGDAAPAA